MNEEPGAVHGDRHVGQHELDALEGADRLTELLALLRVPHRGVERGLADAHRLGADRGARAVENPKRDLVALAFFSQAILDRHLTVGEMERGGGRAADPELALELADGEAWEGRLHEKGRHAALAAALVDRREERDDRRLASVRHPELDAVQHVAVALANGARGDGVRVRAGARLRERERRRDLARGQTRQKTPLLRLGARRDDRPAAGVLDEIDGRGRCARPGDLLDGEAERQGAHVGPAVRLGDVEPHEPLVAEELQGLVGIGFGFVYVGGQRRDWGLGRSSDDAGSRGSSLASRCGASA